MSEAVLYRVEGEVAWLTLNRPTRRNSFDAPMLRLLQERLEHAADDVRLRVLVLAAEGPSFCAGADLRGDGSRAPGELAADAVEALASTLSVLNHLPLPVVTRVQGPVVGGGLGFVAASDVVVASAEATFTLREVRVGAVPAVVAVVLQSRLSASAMRELALTGTTLDAQRAYELGLVNRLTTSLDTAVSAAIGELLEGAPQAQSDAKQLLHELAELDEDEQWRLAVERSQRSFRGEEAVEGLAAFAAKRKPRWTEHPSP